MQKNVYLIGYMAAGKTTTGAELAKRLSYRFFDLDQLIEAEEGMPVTEIFQKKGEVYFRLKEKSILEKSFSFEKTVIACGGGTPCYYDNLVQINKHGFSVWINTPLPIMLQRLGQAAVSRPLLAGYDKEQMHLFIVQQYEERINYYKQAHFYFNPLGENISQLAVDIIAANTTKY